MQVGKKVVTRLRSGQDLPSPLELLLVGKKVATQLRGYAVVKKDGAI